MKFICIVTLVALVISSSNASITSTVNLGVSGSQSISMNYLTALLNGLIPLDFVAQVAQALQVNQTVTAIWINMQSGFPDVQVGDTGFGIQFSCSLSNGCSAASQITASLYSSYLSSVNPTIWAAAVFLKSYLSY